MQITHRLPPATVEHVKAAMAQLDEKRKLYLTTLGAAKEIELECAAIRGAIGQLLAIEETAAKLPRSIVPYYLSSDGSALIGETAEASTPPAAIAPAVEVVEGKPAEGKANGRERATGK